MILTRFWPSVVLLALSGTAPAQEFDSIVVSTEMVTMRDGVKLATDVYRPARGNQVVNEKLPVLVGRTPYSKSELRMGGEYLARRGFVVVAQDVRGRFASEGDFYAFINEGKDGYDTIEWAAGQPWSNGRVGTYGGSYVAWNQYHAAMYKPPHLEAMFAVVGGANFYQEYGYPGGAPSLGWPGWVLGSARSSQHAAANPEASAKLSEIGKQGGLRLREALKERNDVFGAFPAHTRMLEDFYAHPTFDSYWKQRGWHTAGYYGDIKDVPTLFLTGWYDYFGPGAIRNFAALSATQKTTKKLVVGPWPHSVGQRECGDVSFGETAGLDVMAYMAEWFGHWLKGKPLALIGSEPVRVFRMGGGDGTRTSQGKVNHGGEWRTAATWPLAAAKGVRYYLRTVGVLSLAPSSDTGEPSSYHYDPQNPVPTIGGRYGGGATPRCAQNQVCAPSINGCRDAKGLKEVARVAQPNTILAWYRRLIAQKFDGSKHRSYLGRPRVGREVTELIVRMARENSGWGHDRIVGALANLGHVVSDQTVGNILRRYGIAPAPKRSQSMTWRQFIAAHMDVLAGTDFFTVEVLTWRGLVTYYVLFFLHLETRRVTLGRHDAAPN